MVVTKAGAVKTTTAGTAVPMRSIAGDASMTITYGAKIWGIASAAQPESCGLTRGTIRLPMAAAVRHFERSE
jgi:hypothetical protein